MSIKDGGPAFPIVVPGLVYSDGSYDTPSINDTGMSLRDYFAGQALARIGALPAVPITEHARLAYEMADAMLAERERKP